MDDARALLDVETPGSSETGSGRSGTARAMRRAMWGLLWSGVLSAIVVLVLMPKTEPEGWK